MKGDLILRVVVSFLVPFLLLFGFFSITSYKAFGFYSFALAFLYFVMVYVLAYLRKKSISSNNLVFFKTFGRFALGFFVIILFFILAILINFKLPFVYEYIKF